MKTYTHTQLYIQTHAQYGAITYPYGAVANIYGANSQPYGANSHPNGAIGNADLFT